MSTLVQSGLAPLQSAVTGPTSLTPAMQSAIAIDPEPEVPELDFPESHQSWEMLSGLPILLDVSVPVRNFRVRDLLLMEPGTIVPSNWPGATDVPLCSDGVQLCWTEFETVGQTIAVRMTLMG